MHDTQSGEFRGARRPSSGTAHDSGAVDGRDLRDIAGNPRDADMSNRVVANVARNLMRWQFIRVVPDKVLSRLSYMSDRTAVVPARQWCARQCEDSLAFMSAIDSDLAAEAEAFSVRLAARAEQVLGCQGLGAEIATGADYRLLYFLVRHYRPLRVVETGVAAGFSTQAILSALEENGGDGRLWSSDLPYVRKRDARGLVGVLVQDHLRSRWQLSVEGDRRSLPRFARIAAPIDFLHYDSDKTTRGREFALRQLMPALSDNAVILFDDVGDNAHFQQIAAYVSDSHVFKVNRKYAGMLRLTRSR